jgi:hypothetical protein
VRFLGAPAKRLSHSSPSYVNQRVRYAVVSTSGFFISDLARHARQMRPDRSHATTAG